MLHLEDRHLAIVRNILSRHVPGCEVWAFGSRVHGRNLKRFSDLDLAIIADQPINSSHSFAVKEAFSESDLPFRVDVVDWASASDSLREIIRREHEVLLEGQAAATATAE